MSSNSAPRESRGRRALVALPILAAAVVMMPVIVRFGQAMTPFVDNIAATGRFELNGISVPVKKEFFGIAIVDQPLSIISIAFTFLYSFANPAAYWQSLVFLVEYSGVYAILLFESCRGSNKGTFFEYPFITVMLAQLAGFGNTEPAYLYALYIFNPAEKLASAKIRAIDASYAAAILPSLALGYYVPLLLSYFPENLETRHWWNWVWQIYPVWCSALLFVFALAIKHTYNPNQCLASIRVTVGVIAVINAAIYWYTLATSGLSLMEMFLPRYYFDVPGDFAESFRTIIQYDYLCGFGAMLLWLTYQLNDLKVAGVRTISWTQMTLIAVVIGLSLGLGNLALLGWLLREELLVSWKAQQPSDIRRKKD